MARKLEQSHHSWHSAVALMLAVLLFGSILFAWRYYSIVEGFEKYQEQLAWKQAVISVNSIESLTESLRNRMIAVALDDFFFLDLKDFKKNVSVQEHLQQRLKNYFPEMISYSLVNKDGELIGGDIEFKMGELCLHDARLVASKLMLKETDKPYVSAIHPVPNDFHFDVMFPVYLDDTSLVFFMSFNADVLPETLRRQKVANHPVYVVKKEDPTLIEFSYDGTRESFRRAIRLSPQELKKVRIRKDIPNTQWRVLVMENTRVIERFKKSQLSDSLVLYAGFLIAWVLISWILMQQEHKRKRWLSKLDFLSYHDPLTGAINRRKLESTLTVVLEAYKSDGLFSGILYMDLNGFKPINDKYGHAVGDTILKIFVKRLQSCCRGKDVVARMGGDEFVVVLVDLGENEQQAYMSLTEAAHRCHQNLADPMDILVSEHETVSLNVTASIGSLLINQTHITVDDLLKQADEFMYRAKHSGMDQPHVPHKNETHH